MAIMRWTPSGVLDVATDPTELPQQSDGKNVVSGAMTRCTNLQLDRQGIAQTRNGYERLNATALTDEPLDIICQNGDRYAFASSNIYKNESSITTDLDGTQRWGAVLYQAYNSTGEDIFCSNGTDRIRIDSTGAHEWGIDPPTAAPTVSKSFDYVYTYGWEVTEQLITDTYHVSNAPFLPVDPVTFGDQAQYMHSWEELQLLSSDSSFPSPNSSETTYVFERSTDLSQKFGVVYTWVRKNGDVIECESSPSPVAYVQNEGGISVTIPSSCSDPQVTHARIYRTLGDGAAYYYDTELAIGATTCVLIKRDEALGTEASSDNDRPIASNILAGPAFGGYLFLADGNKLYYSRPQQPEYWPATYYVECGSEQFPIIAIGVLGGLVYAATAIEIYMVQGTGHGSFSPLPMGAMTGTQSRLAFACVHGSGIYHLGTDGVYLFRPGSDQRITDQHFRPVMLGETVGSIPAMKTSSLSKCWLHHFKGRLWFGYNTTGTTYPGNILVLDIVKNRTVHYQYDIEISAIAIDHKNDRIVGCDAAGYVIELDYGTTDAFANISWQIETKEFGELRKYFPRSARYDLALNNGATANGNILLDGTVKQTHPITVSRDTKRRLITGCNGDRLSIRISGTGPVSIYGAEAE